MKCIIFICQRLTLGVTCAGLVYAILSLSTGMVKRGFLAQSEVHNKTSTELHDQIDRVRDKLSSMTEDQTKNGKEIAQFRSTVQSNESQNSQPVCQDPFLDEFQTQQRYLCLSINSHLGNQIFSFASSYGVARKLNMTVVLTKTSQLLNVFNLDAVVVGNVCVCKLYAKLVSEDKHCAFDEKFFQLTGPGNYFVQSYLQSWKYFHHVKDDIRRQFKFNDRIQSAALGVLKNITSKLSTNPLVTVGVHVRRGDMDKNPVIAGLGFRVAPRTYYPKAMDFFRDKFSNVVFIVCSDNMNWAKGYVLGSDVAYVEGNSPEVDFAVLSNCQHSIMSVGTFGWWSAFLAGGQVVYYKHPARNRSFLRRQFSDDFSDYFYPGWLGME